MRTHTAARVGWWAAFLGCASGRRDCQGSRAEVHQDASPLLRRSCKSGDLVGGTAGSRRALVRSPRSYNHGSGLICMRRSLAPPLALYSSAVGTSCLARTGAATVCRVTKVSSSETSARRSLRLEVRSREARSWCVCWKRTT